MSSLSELYQNVILEHNRSPRNYRPMADAERHAEGHNPLCGDQVVVWVRMNGDVIEDVSFQGSGCAISRASASLMTSAVKGRTREEMASLYDRCPRAKLMTNVGIGPKVDVWQHARIVSRADGSVEHWLNGVKVLEFQRGSNDYRAKLAASKFKDSPAFGEAPRGRISLQDHGDAVSFRSIRIRKLD